MYIFIHTNRINEFMSMNSIYRVYIYIFSYMYMNLCNHLFCSLILFIYVFIYIYIYISISIFFVGRRPGYVGLCNSGVTTSVDLRDPVPKNAMENHH